MGLKLLKNTVLFIVLIAVACSSKSKNEASKNENSLRHEQEAKRIVVGANQTDTYLQLLQGKNVGIVANQTSVIFQNSIDSIYNIDAEKNEYNFNELMNRNTHLVDSLLKLKINIKKVFAPEHGFRGQADAGEVVKDGIDVKTGLPIISLYGKNKKPSSSQLRYIDVVVFDIQDVGARFYTYISTLHYVMEACAENNIPVLVLDRPNPNGHYIDGPILEQEHKSFVGMHPVPIVHGMTIGEYAKMINGEGWLENGIKCDLKVISVKNYSHKSIYNLPIKPSPNLPNAVAINLYPSLCLFEGTSISVGRGTHKQFQVIGTPHFDHATYSYTFKPKSNSGAKFPKHQDKVCYGLDLSKTQRLHQLNLDWLIEFFEMHKSYNSDANFFNEFFTKLAGTEKLQKQIENGLSEDEIRQSWSAKLDQFKSKRQRYLLYKD